MDDLINDFLAETREMLQALSGAIVAWETDPADRARLDEIFRFVHTVKGNCGFFELPRLRQLSHAAEDALAEVRAGRREADATLVSAVLAVIDRIGELVQALETGEPLASEDDEQLIAAVTGTAAPLLVEAQASPAAPAAKKGMRSIRLSVELLDRMMSGVSDAVLARNELARRLRDAPRDVAVEAAFERLSACIADIREAITRTRMQRIDNLFSALPRMVRDLAADLGKQVQLQVEGGEVELDREMIEMIRDPLTHIIRNAVDHGIEAPVDRASAGKPAAGRLKVSARQSGNQILIEVADDGRGIDADALVRRAVAAGTITGEAAERLSAADSNALIFTPGLSTAGEVTTISGRGVGMDVVRANVERIGGLVEIDSRPGQGVRLCMRVPLTLTIIPALTVSAGGQTFALPRAAIEEILRASGPTVRVERVGDARVATVRDRRVALIDLDDLLGTGPREGENDGRIILLKPGAGATYALRVDAVHDHEELVIKPAAPPVMAAGIYAGTTLADDGRPILLLDPSGIAAQAQLATVEQPADPESPATANEERGQATLLLFKSLDGRLRAAPVGTVERIEDVPAEAIGFSAGRLRARVGERILPLAGCDSPPASGRLRILRLSDGASQLAYAFGDVVDVRKAALDLQPAPQPGEIAGVALIDGQPVELLDVHWLFASHVEAVVSGHGRPAVCAIPADDPWMANMLRPLVESLGYRVVGEGVAADLVIASAEEAPPIAAQGAQLLRIRSSAEADGDNDDSIYRYDRAALVAALRRRRAGGAAHG
ncbi:MAG TPA: chemotaxis protein CheA [Allosphingosinicella sp.]